MSEEMATASSRMLREVLAGLARTPPELSPKWFYDHRGSELFEAITRLPEYYPTRTERALLAENGTALVERTGPATLVELGAGNSDKTRVLLDAMEARGKGLYVPVDVSADFLEASAERLRAEYPDLRIEPAVADISRPLQLPHDLPGPVLYALLGSTLGNFHESAAVGLLRQVRVGMNPGDVLLLGADLRPGPRKSVEKLEAAYNDAQGVTADFNRNMLHVLNREVGADFDPDAFEHRAFYDAREGRIEMHLVARGRQTVTFADGSAIEIGDGESLLTEISAKYDRATLARLMGAAGLTLREWIQDENGLFALVLGVSD